MDTIFVLNVAKQVIDILSNNGATPSAPFFDDVYTSELDTGAETYEFTTFNNPRTNVTLEVGNYVLFKYDDKYKLFQITETTDEHSDGKKLLTVYAEMAGMELLNDYCEPFTLEGNFITFMNRVLQDTNWAVGEYSASLLDDIQVIEVKENENAYSLIQDHLSTFGGVELEFRTEFIGNQLTGLYIDCYANGERGNKTYRRFEYGEDVKGITRTRNTNDLATAVIGEGKNGVTFKEIECTEAAGYPFNKPLQQNFVVDIEANDIWNNGGKYIKTVHKVDTDDPYVLVKECWNYLQEVKQPKFDYDVDLALVTEEYQDIGIGDTNYILDFDYQPAILLEARVGTLELSFSDPRNNKCTLTNYKELTSILQETIDLDIIGNMIESKFPISGDKIMQGVIGGGHIINGSVGKDQISNEYTDSIKQDSISASVAEVGTLIADKASIKDLHAVNATIDNLKANKADINDLHAVNATIDNLKANKADITDLTATNANITNLKAQVGNIETLISGNATTGDLQTIHLTAANTTIDNALIKNAMIDTISANKINTGTLNTNNVIIQSDDGGIVLSGSTQQFKDKEGHVRVQIGKDASGNFTFCLFSQDGVGILLDETGIKAGAVPDGLIVNDMVSEEANISGNKLDISSVITQINNNETTINSSHIKLDDTGQSLLVAFNTLKNKVDTIEEVTVSGDLSSVIEKVNTHTTQIGVMQGQITSLIDNTTITKQDGTVVQLKDEYNSTVSTVNSNTTKIGSLETNYNKVSGDIETVTSKQSTLEQDLNGFKTSVSNTYSGLETRVKNAEETLTTDGITRLVGDYYATSDHLESEISRIDQTSGAISAEVSKKLDTSSLSTKIQQSSTDIKIGFNGISDNFVLDEEGISWKNVGSSYKNISIKKGSFMFYNWMNGSFLGGISPLLLGGSAKNNAGIGIINSNNATFIEFARDDSWLDSSNGSQSPFSAMTINFLNRGTETALLQGIQLFLPMYARNGIDFAQTGNITNLNNLYLNGEIQFPRGYKLTEYEQGIDMPTGTLKTTQLATNYIANNSGSYIYFKKTVSPDQANTYNCGEYYYPWAKVYSSGGVSAGSDRNLKENIKYVRSQDGITYDDMYSFVKDDLELAKFNYKGQVKEEMGFIAQDLLYNLDGTDNKVGQFIINPISVPTEEEINKIKENLNEGQEYHDPTLQYDMSTYINVLAGALKKTIIKVEEQQKQIDQLTTLIDKLINKEGDNIG